MKSETPSERTTRNQYILASVIETLNENHKDNKDAQTESYFKGYKLYVKGFFWRDAVAVSRCLGLTVQIVERDHVYFF